MLEINSESNLTEFFKTENRLRRIFILTLSQPKSKSWIFHLSYLLSRQVAGEISEDFSAFKCLLIRNILSSLYISTSFDNFLPSSSSLLLVLGTFLDIISSFPLLSTLFSLHVLLLLILLSLEKKASKKRVVEGEKKEIFWCARLANECVWVCECRKHQQSGSYTECFLQPSFHAPWCLHTVGQFGRALSFSRFSLVGIKWR